MSLARVLLLLAAALAFSRPALTQQRLFPDPLLERLTGTWSMTGAVRNQPATYSLSAAWVLNHQFLKLDMRDVANRPDHQATAYIGYDDESHGYVAHWLDASEAGRSAATLGFGRRSENAIPFVFEFPDGPVRMTLTLNPDGRTWTVLMQDQASTGTWHEFAHFSVHRR